MIKGERMSDKPNYSVLDEIRCVIEDHFIPLESKVLDGNLPEVHVKLYHLFGKLLDEIYQYQYPEPQESEEVKAALRYAERVTGKNYNLTDAEEMQSTQLLSIENEMHALADRIERIDKCVKRIEEVVERTNKAVYKLS